MEAGQLKPDLVGVCENIRMGTALFAKVYRIVTRWYGSPTAKDVLKQLFDDAIIAWQTGYFDGTAVFGQRIRVRSCSPSRSRPSAMAPIYKPAFLKMKPNPWCQSRLLPPLRTRVGS